MQEQSTESGGPSSSLWDRLEDVARDHIQQFIHAVLKDEVTELAQPLDGAGPSQSPHERAIQRPRLAPRMA